MPCCQATLKSGIGNRKETENQNRESTNQRKQVRGKLLCEVLPLKIREQVKKPSNKNSLSVEICATLICSEGYDYENLRACLHGGRVPWLTGLPAARRVDTQPALTCNSTGTVSGLLESSFERPLSTTNKNGRPKKPFFIIFQLPAQVQACSLP